MRLVVGIILGAAAVGPADRVGDDLSALQSKRARHLGIGLVEADLQADLADLGVEHRVFAIAGNVVEALAHGLVHLAVLSDEALGTHQHRGVVGGIGPLGILLDHRPDDVHVVLLGKFGEHLGGFAVGHHFGQLVEQKLVLAAVLQQRMDAVALQDQLGEHQQVDALLARFVDVADHVLAVGLHMEGVVGADVDGGDFDDGQGLLPFRNGNCQEIRLLVWEDGAEAGVSPPRRGRVTARRARGPLQAPSGRAPDRRSRPASRRWPQRPRWWRLFPSCRRPRPRRAPQGCR